MLADQLHVRRHGSCRRLGGAAAGVTRRAFGAALALLLGSMAVPVSAEGTKVKVGVLKLSSSAPIFLGVERGTFREFGIEPELVYFQAARLASLSAVAAGPVAGSPAPPAARLGRRGGREP